MHFFVGIIFPILISIISGGGVLLMAYLFLKKTGDREIRAA
jgi:hypothetical protein